MNKHEWDYQGLDANGHEWAYCAKCKNWRDNDGTRKPTKTAPTLVTNG